MQRRQRVRTLWIALVGAVVLSAVIVPLWVTADSGQGNFTATLYSDVIRFEADGVASLRVTIYDLAENELWSSALVMGDFIDWDRANARGERLANGLYLYLAQGWDSADVLILNKTGKVVLLPGDQVELRAAPVAGVVDGATEIGDWPVTTKGLSDTGIFKDVGIGVDPPQRILHISEDHFAYTHMTNDASGHTGYDGITLGLRDAPNTGYVRLRENWPFQIWTNDTIRLTVSADGFVGIGTNTPGRILHVHDQHFSYAHMTNSASGSSGTDGLSLGLRDAPNAGYIRLRENWPFDIYTNDLQRLRVAADGNVGIGTTSPGYKLDVSGTGRFTGAVTIGAYTLPTVDGSSGQVLATNGSGTVSWQTNPGALTLWSAGGGNDIYKTFTSGNVGIGTTTPGKKLHVAGDIRMDGYMWHGTAPFLHNAGASGNTGVGVNALLSISSAAAYYNTGVGEDALRAISTGDYNTAVGYRALHSTATSQYNTAMGYYALEANTEGKSNTAVGCWALEANTEGDFNTAVGKDALPDNLTGDNNSALGFDALTSNKTGSDNTAVGAHALHSNNDGDDNTAVGVLALQACETDGNTAVGALALVSLSTGVGNTAIGSWAGHSLTSGHNNIYIENTGASTESNKIRIGNTIDHNATYIAGIRGTATGEADAIPVYIDSNGQLGTISSSVRFKTDIADVGSTSDVLHDLRPVTFRYNDEIDPQGITQYGLIAEEVAEVAPDLVIYDDDGDPYTVRYEQLVPLLLSEMQRTDAEIDAQQDQINELQASNRSLQIQLDDVLARLATLEQEVRD